MTILAHALKEAIDELPPTVGVPTGKDISTMLDSAFDAAGYALQLHQHGISGTSIIAVKHEDVTLDIPTA